MKLEAAWVKVRYDVTGQVFKVRDELWQESRIWQAVLDSRPVAFVGLDFNLLRAELGLEVQEEIEA